MRGVVTNHVVLADGFGQRLALDVAAGVTLDAVFLLPSGWRDAAPGVLVALDERGKAGALASAGVASARARGWAVLAPDLRGTGESAAGEFELATAAWLLDRDLLASRVDDVLALVQWLSERYSTGQQINARRIAVWGPGRSGSSPLLAAALDERIAGAASGPFAESLEELLVESPAITPMAFPFAALETFDLADLPRLAQPRPLHVVRPSERCRRRRRRPARRARGVRMIRELADGIWSCEQDDGPRIVRQVVVAGDDAVLVVDTGLPGVPAQELLPLVARLGRRDVAVLISHPDSDHLGGTAELLAAEPAARVLAGALDLPLVGDPERMIRERYARFAVHDDVPFGPAAAARARERAGGAFGPPRPPRRGRGDRPRRPRRRDRRDARSQPRAHVAAWIPDAGLLAAGDAVMGNGIPTRDGRAADPSHVRPAGRLPRDDRARPLAPVRILATGHEPILAGEAVAAFLDASRAASDRLAALVAAALDEAPRTLLELCGRVHGAYGGLPDERVADLALTVDGHLADLIAAERVVVTSDNPRRFRSRA